jgi:rhodanese-related sulfurtransferase
MKKRILKQCLILLALATTGAAYSLISGISPLPWVEPELAVGEIGIEDAKTIDAIWVDARPLDEYEQAHIPEAIFFAEEAWDEGLVGLTNVWLTEPRPIVVYCGSESCGTSQRIAERLRDALPDAEIYSLEGGWDAWQQ